MSFLPNNFNVVKMKYFVLSFIRLSKLPPVSFTKFLLLSSSFAFRIFYCMLRPTRSPSQAGRSIHTALSVQHLSINI